jgi:hypothetical protein
MTAITFFDSGVIDLNHPLIRIAASDIFFSAPFKSSPSTMMVPMSRITKPMLSFIVENRPGRVVARLAIRWSKVPPGLLAF